MSFQSTSKSSPRDTKAGVFQLQPLLSIQFELTSLQDTVCIRSHDAAGVNKHLKLTLLQAL